MLTCCVTLSKRVSLSKPQFVSHSVVLSVFWKPTGSNILTPGRSGGDKAFACNLSSNHLIGFWTCTPVFYHTWKKGFGSLKHFVNDEWGLKPLPDLMFFRAGLSAYLPCRQMLVVDQEVTPGAAALSLDSPVLPHTWVTFPFNAIPPAVPCGTLSAQSMHSLGCFLWSLSSWKTHLPSSECLWPSVYASGVCAFGVIYGNIFCPLLGHKC